MHVRFGIATAPQQVSYDDILRVWREADTIPEIEHAWLFDHLLPIAGDPNGPIFEGWTLLSALAAQTHRLRLGLPMARREYAANGLPYHDAGYAVGSLAEALTVIKRLWAEDEPFGFDGRYLQLTGAFGNPKPVQRPHPPIVIGGRATGTLRVVAEHADVWNFPGGDVDDALQRGAVLDRLCAETGRDPATITRSLVLPVSYHDPSSTRAAIGQAEQAGFHHLVLSLAAPYPSNVARWVATELISEPA